MRKGIVQSILVIFAAVICMTTMSVYMKGTLNGNINYFFLPAKMFGVPTELAQKGIEPLFYGKNESGWDGQFYYYISNDLLGLKDIPKHIDVPAYRYQRIGLPLYAAFVAFITGHSWVSPEVYYFSYLGLVLVAVWAIGRIMSMRNGWVFTGIAWVAGVGTQITLLNGLPDAAADAFLIVGTLALLKSKRWLGVGAFLIMMSVLSRESYVIFPVFFLAFLLLKRLIEYPSKDWVNVLLREIRSRVFLALCVPVIVFLIWQIYLRHHFGFAPSEQTVGILGLPFKEWWIALHAGLSGHHYLVSAGIQSYLEAASLICFMLLLIMVIFFASKVLIKYQEKPEWIVALAGGAVIMSLLYLCFGRTVMMYYTFYMKAANVFIFLIPLFVAEANISTSKRYLVYTLLVGIVAVTSGYLWKYKIAFEANSGYSRFTRVADVTRTAEAKCLVHYDATVQLTGLEDVQVSNSFPFMKGPRVEVFWVNLTNHSGEPFVSLAGKGSVNMSYQWLSADTHVVVKEGIRSYIPEGIKDGETVSVPIVVLFPTAAGNYILRLSPVQEGCEWFYNANPHSAQDVRFTIR
ncbi:hypothetical protein PCO85_03905 [Prodigiosinella aquatilis]|nr:hypothetical protein [Prodigiosinella sp. LS101]WJV54603.1 hypothetical protein PCO85_03905 [Prodigiosinella sp. LS101]WJV58965.1 hypothetical protein PCO84_03915 [Pectobacteriaceae bacterium C111]